MNDILLLLKEGQVPGHRLHVIIFAVSRRLGLGRGKEVNVKNMEGKNNTRSDQSEEPGERLGHPGDVLQLHHVLGLKHLGDPGS